MAFRTFERTWWLDKACKRPGAGRKRLARSQTFDTAEEAHEACRSANLMNYGPAMRGARGLAMEFEEV